jgi:serine/threonine-protein kinase OSR1/STK39
MASDASEGASDAPGAPSAYPTNASAYELLEEIGHGVSATVRARRTTRRDATRRRRARRRARDDARRTRD